MNWEKLDLHIENLIPGTVLLTIVITGWAIPLKALTVNDIILGVAFIGTAYMIGAVGNVLARFLLDFVCRKTIRATFMRFFIGERLEVTKPTSAAINKRFSEVITAGLSCGNSRVEAEVEKRRQTCRILRSTLVPAVLAIIALGKNLNWDILKTLLVGLCAYGVLLVLYAYSEVIIFQEGYRGEQIIKKQKELPYSSLSPNRATR